MSSFDEKLEEELEKLKKKKKQTVTPSKPFGNSLSYLPGYASTTQKITSELSAFDDDIAPLITSGLKKEILAPIRSKQEEETEKDRKWFQKSSLFDDGWDFGDLTKTILGSREDLYKNIGAGLIGIGEKIFDTATTIAPYITQGMMNQSGMSYNIEAQRLTDAYISQGKESAEKIVAKDLYDEKKVADAIIGVSDLGRVNKALGVNSEEHSSFGEKTDSLAQSGGQLLGQMGANALLPGSGMVLMGVTAFGSEAENALNQGATLDEAALSGTISAGAEILTEKLGGISFGGKTLTDAAFSKLSRFMTNKISNLLITSGKVATDALAEGGEEIISGYMSAIGQKLTYMDEKEITEIFSSEDLLESFIGGVVLGGMGGGVDAVQSSAKGIDPVSDLSKNDKKVVDKVYKDLVAEEEQKGKVSQKRKSEIYDEVLDQLDRGGLSTETIEEVLGGENYKAYQDTIKNENDALAELAELYEGDELKQRTDEFLSNSRRGEMAKTLSDSVYDMVKDSRLGESYRDRARRGQKFEADVTKYDEKQRSIVQKAIDSGVLNNTNRTHDMVDFVARVSADTGVLFDFTNNAKLKDSIFGVNGKIVDGYITENGITINVNSPKYINTIVGHEITHAFEGSEQYDVLEKAMFEYAKEKGTYKDVLKDAYEMYRGVEGYEGYDGLKKIKKEAVANLVGDYLFTDKNFVNHLSANHQNIFQKAWNEVKYMVKMARAGSNEAKKLLEVQKAFEEAYRAGGKTTAETKLSLSEIIDENQKSYGIGVHLDSTLLDNLSAEERVGMVKEYVKELGGESFTAYDPNGNSVNVTIAETKRKFKNKSGKVVPVNKDLTSKNIGNEVKQEAIALVDELIVTSEFDGSKASQYPHGWLDNNGKNNWEYWKTYIQDKNNTIWEATLNVANTADGEKILYDISPIKKVGRSVKSDTLPTNGNIAQNSDNVKPTADPDIRYSLSAEQKEYFKDSVVRDENGNLKVMYHGTPNGDYTIFKDGTYFTDNKEYADRYQNPGASSISTGKVASNPKTFEVYLDIKKPFDLNDAEARDIYINEYIKGGNAMGINPYLSDAEYAKIKTIDWTEGEDLREFLIDNGYDYDGLVLDEGADGGYGNEVKSRGTSYVIFKPEQAKNIDNSKPTADPDIRLSLSNEATEPAKNGNWHISGKDVAYEEIAPVAETVSKTESVAPVEAVSKMETTTEELFPDDLESIHSELANLHSHQFELRGALEAAVSMGDTSTMSMLTQEYESVTARIRELEAQEAERFDSLDDADAPMDMDTQHDEVADATPLNKKTVTDLSKKVKSLLGVKNNRTGEVVSMIEAYSRSDNPSSEKLFEELKEKFGKYTDKSVDDATREVKALLRSYRINVSDSIKSEIADYGDLMRRNFGRVRFSKEGLAVDEVYSDLSAGYPGYFPESIINPTDQLMQIINVANMEAETVTEMTVDDETLADAARTIARTVRAYKQSQMQALTEKESKESFNSLVKSADEFAPAMEGDIGPVVKQKEQTAKIEKPTAPEGQIKTVKERLTAKMQNLETELENNRRLRAESWLDYDSEISRAQAEYNAKSNKNTVSANDLLRRIERLNRMKHNTDADFSKRISDLEERVAKVGEEVRTGESTAEQGAMRQELHNRIVSNIRSEFENNGFSLETVLGNAKDLSTFATVDNTPQRVMEKALGYKAGGILADLTVNKVAQNETKGIKWLNAFTDRKNGVLAQISKQYHIKPGSKESAAAQMYAEGFYVTGTDKNGEWSEGKSEIVPYGDAELAQDFPNAKVRENIKGLARDPRIRQIYDGTLEKINESRARNAYPEIQRLDNYFLHFRAMDDAFSRLGIPFNPKDIKAKDLPTDLNGVTADLKPGQPYFASAMHREGKRTSFDLLGGLERYLSSAKNQIYHIDDIQTLRALRNYVADTYGRANGLKDLDLMTEEEAQARIKEVYKSHLSTFAKFLNEEANVIAGKTALIDRAAEGIIGRRGLTFLDTVNKQVGSNMVGFNVSSSLTNFLAPVQAFAKTNKFDFVKAFAQTTANKVGSIFGKTDGFAENSPVVIRRKGEDRFYRTPWQKASDAGYLLMGAVDDFSTELIARAKYNELTRKGMGAQQAHIEADKWTSRLMGDRSLGQQPQLYNSKTLGMITKFQLEVRNQLDAQFYDTIQETKASNEDIQNGLLRNAKTAAKVGSTFFQLAVAQHLFGKVFESIAGYNPAFDIISAIIKAAGWDDDEDDEDTVLDNIQEGFLELMGDLPYTSTLTGGRIPISSALPVEQAFTGKDQYGNKVHDNPLAALGITLAQALPYYALPGGYGQAKKTYQGLSMFDDDLPVSGSYTKSGNLRFPVEDTLGNKVQAGLFGQYASANARDYFDNERSPLKPKQIQEYIDSDLPIADYWKYREGLSGLASLDAKGDYIGNLDLPISTKNLFINNIAQREEPIDMTDYSQYPNFSEFDWAEQNEEKYAFLQEHGMSYADYEKLDEDSKKAYTWAYNNPERYEFIKEQGLSATEYYSLDDDTKDAYKWAYDNPEMFTVSKAISDDFLSYYQYKTDLSKLNAKDENGESVSGLKKERVIEYINNLDIDYGQKIILFRSMYDSKADQEAYNADIVDYLNSRDDISYQEMVTILKKLGFTVKGNTVTW
jgi:hypothetical protein